MTFQVKTGLDSIRPIARWGSPLCMQGAGGGGGGGEGGGKQERSEGHAFTIVTKASSPGGRRHVLTTKVMISD